MDGAAVIVALLTADAEVTALVPAGENPPRISADALAQNVALPAIRVMKISSSDRNALSRGTQVKITQRIQVEAHAATLPGARAVMEAIRGACSYRIEPSVAGVSGLSRVVVLSAGEGPEGISGDTMARVETQDFLVSYNKDR